MYLARKGEQKELDIEFNKVGSIKLLLAKKLQLHTKGLQHFSPKKINTPPFHHLVPGNQVRAGEGRHVCNRSQNGAGEGAEWEMSISLAWGRRPTQSAWRFGKFIGHFEKAPDPSHTQATITPGEQRSPLSLAWVTCARPVHSFIHPLSMAMQLHTQAPSGSLKWITARNTHWASWMLDWTRTSMWSRNSGPWLLSQPCWGHHWAFSTVGQREMGHWKPRGQLLSLQE